MKLFSWMLCGMEYSVLADNEANAEIFLRTYYDSDRPESRRALETLLSHPPRVDENVCGFVSPTAIQILKTNETFRTRSI